MSAATLYTAIRKPGTPPWLVTFVDLVLLLLSFFVLIFAMSRPDVARYAAMAQSYAETFNPRATVEAVFVRSRSFITERTDRDEELAYLEAALAAAFARSENLARLQIRSTDRGLVVTLNDATAPDGSAVAPAWAPALFDMAGVLANIDNRLAVVGLADSSVESWPTALARAAAVTGALRRAGYDRPMAVLARDTKGGGARRRAVELQLMASEDAAP